MPFTPQARRAGIGAALGMAGLSLVYASVLAVGLLSLRSPADPIADPWFTALEVLILIMMPVFVTLMAVIHVWASAAARLFTLIGLVFAGLLAGLTSSVHFVVLIVSRQSEFSGVAGLPLLTAFEWPSIAYILDILAWDVFFALSVLFTQQAFADRPSDRWIRALMIASGVIALAGLSGVVTGDMQLRNIGIAGYAGVFPVAAVLMARRFWLSRPDRP